jgi:hypothetical protein
MSLLKELKKKIDEFEKDGRYCMGINLPHDMAVELRKELRYLYGRDLGENPAILFGKEVISIDAPELSFEE